MPPARRREVGDKPSAPSRPGEDQGSARDAPEAARGQPGVDGRWNSSKSSAVLPAVGSARAQHRSGWGWDGGASWGWMCPIPGGRDGGFELFPELSVRLSS